jgi:hypothetical protein
VKPGVRALGVAESFEADVSTLAGAVVRADRVVDDLCYTTCTVGGTDATERLAGLWDRLDRPDVRYLLLAGIAPAWYNLFDLPTLQEATDRPTIAVTFEEPGGSLREAMARAFEELARRLAVFERQPARRRLTVDGETLFLRAVGCSASEARDVVRAFTPEGGRPEPLRVARLAARAGERFRRGERG